MYNNIFIIISGVDGFAGSPSRSRLGGGKSWGA